MNDGFVTQALQGDRYLKAIKLIGRFETELERQLEHTVREIVSENPHLFSDTAEPDFRQRRSSSSVPAFARTDYKMDRYKTDDPDANQLSMSLRIHWVEPTALGHEGDGALAISVLRVKYAGDEDHQRVKQATTEDEWPSLHFGEDPWGSSPGIIYTPVETAEDIERSHETFRDYFAEYGAEYGVAHDTYASN